MWGTQCTQWRSRLGHCGTGWKVAGFLVDLILPAARWPGVDQGICLYQEYQEYILRGKGDRCVRLTFIADCLQILGASSSWSSHGLSKPVQGVLYQP